MTPKRSALGRGLSDLMGGDELPAAGSSTINDIPLAQITPNPNQPRTDFDEESLRELADSIRELGIIQPLSLRKTGPESYQILAGERRYRAAGLAGLESVPAYIRTASDAELTEMALIENIQREDLNAIEIALTFRKLIDQYNLTQERLSERIGKKRATVANFLRLLRLPSEVQLGLRDKRLDMGHARALLTLDDPRQQLALFKRIVKEGLSVRRVEQLAKAMREAKPEEPANNDAAGIFTRHDIDMLRGRLSDRFSTPVSFACDRSGKGKIAFSFASEDELVRLITIFDRLNTAD